MGSKDRGTLFSVFCQREKYSESEKKGKRGDGRGDFDKVCLLFSQNFEILVKVKRNGDFVKNSFENCWLSLEMFFLSETNGVNFFSLVKGSSKRNMNNGVPNYKW